MSIDIKPLGKKTLQKALNVAVEIFGENDRKPIEREFKASLGIEPDQTEVEENLRISESKYFLPEENGDPVGVTGFYKFKGHEDEAWLGWFGVRSAHFGKGLGKTLMVEAFNRAASEGVKTLRIWTTTDPMYAEACKLYERMGFKREIYKPNAKDAGTMVLVFSKAAHEGATHDIDWATTGYDIDAEEMEIPKLNKQYGFEPDRIPVAFAEAANDSKPVAPVTVVVASAGRRSRSTVAAPRK